MTTTTPNECFPIKKWTNWQIYCWRRKKPTKTNKTRTAKMIINDFKCYFNGFVSLWIGSVPLQPFFLCFALTLECTNASERSRTRTHRVAALSLCDLRYCPDVKRLIKCLDTPFHVRATTKDWTLFNWKDDATHKHLACHLIAFCVAFNPHFFLFLSRSRSLHIFFVDLYKAFSLFPPFSTIFVLCNLISMTF